MENMESTPLTEIIDLTQSENDDSEFEVDYDSDDTLPSLGDIFLKYKQRSSCAVDSNKEDKLQRIGHTLDTTKGFSGQGTITSPFTELPGFGQDNHDDNSSVNICPSNRSAEFQCQGRQEGVSNRPSPSNTVSQESDEVILPINHHDNASTKDEVESPAPSQCQGRQEGVSSKPSPSNTVSHENDEVILPINHHDNASTKEVQGPAPSNAISQECDEVILSINYHDNANIKDEVHVPAPSSNGQHEPLHKACDIPPAQAYGAQQHIFTDGRISAVVADVLILGVYGERAAEHGSEYACMVEMWLRPEDGVPKQLIREYKREAIRNNRTSTLRKRKRPSSHDMADERVLKRVRGWQRGRG